LISQQVLGQFIEDDAQAMAKILEQKLQTLAVDYLLSEQEIGKVLEEVQKLQFDRE
jgi:hypothetical protein